jgi:rhodanese-related sulfurtransferase
MHTSVCWLAQTMIERRIDSVPVLDAAGALVGLGVNAASPHPARLGEPVLPAAEAQAGMCQLPGQLPSIPRISVEEAAPMCAACTAAFIDARSASEYAAGHVAGALHLQPGAPADLVLWRLSGFKTVIVYDRDPSCQQADEVAKALIAKGVPDVRVLTGAWPAWLAAGAPGAAGPCTLCGEGFSGAAR